MRWFFRVLFSLLMPGGAAAATSLENARQAQAMLGGAVWSEVIRIENVTIGGRYPPVLHALVFENGGLLWFYTDRDGTQSLSLAWNQAAREKQDLGPLLRAIDPGFVRFSAEPGTAGLVRSASGKLPNGCFIESLAALRDRVSLGEPLARPRLLSFYEDTPAGLNGHTVLTYLTPQGLMLLDPERSPRPRPLPRRWADNPTQIAQAAAGGRSLRQARWVPTDTFSPRPLAHLNPTASPLFADTATPREMP